MFSRKNIGSEPQKCEKCGSDKVFFVQHAHGNYPILDYVCPKRDLGGGPGVAEWDVSPTGGDEAADEWEPSGTSLAGGRRRALRVGGHGPGPAADCCEGGGGHGVV